VLPGLAEAVRLAHDLHLVEPIEGGNEASAVDRVAVEDEELHPKVWLSRRPG
jgi:hypothetical protein